MYMGTIGYLTGYRGRPYEPVNPPRPGPVRPDRSPPHVPLSTTTRSFPLGIQDKLHKPTVTSLPSPVPSPTYVHVTSSRRPPSSPSQRQSLSSEFRRLTRNRGKQEPSSEGLYNIVGKRSHVLCHTWSHDPCDGDTTQIGYSMVTSRDPPTTPYSNPEVPIPLRPR